MEELSLYILDIAQNSIEANSSIVKIKIIENYQNDILLVQIEDDGAGLDEDTLRKVEQPFYTTKKTKNSGMGVPKFKKMVEKCEGIFNITSKKNVGTVVSATFKLSNEFLPPLGNISDTLFTLCVNDRNVDIYFLYQINEKTLIIDTKEIKKELDNIPLNKGNMLSLLKKYINEKISTLK